MDPTKGEITHAKVLNFMRGQLLMRDDMQDCTVRTVNEIAKMAASQVKIYVEQSH